MNWVILTAGGGEGYDDRFCAIQGLISFMEDKSDRRRYIIPWDDHYGGWCDRGAWASLIGYHRPGLALKSDIL